MNDSTLLKIAFILTIVGTFTLFIITNTYSLQEIPIKQIDNSYVDKNIKVTGKLVSFQDNNHTAILNIEQQVPKQITVFLFKDHPFDLEKDKMVTVEGEVKEYNNNFELIADKIIIQE